MRKPYLYCCMKHPAIQEASYTHEQLNLKNAIERGWGGKKKPGRPEGPLRRGPPVQVGAWARKGKLLRFRKSCGPGVILLLAGVKPSLLACRAQRAARSVYEHPAAGRGWHESSNSHNKRDNFLHLSLSLPKWGDHHALQTTSTYPVSEQNKVILTAWSIKASAVVCPPPLANAHRLLLSGQVSNTTGLHRKGSYHLGTHLLLLLPAPQQGWEGPL